MVTYLFCCWLWFSPYPASAALGDLGRDQILVHEIAVNISQDGISAIYRRECGAPNFQPALTAYQDGSGNLTIGCGHAGHDVTPGMTITREQADALFRSDIKPCEDAINATIKVPLKQNQFDALCSFSFNVGVGAFQSSTLVKKLNAGQYDQVPKELERWNESNKQVNRGLVNRRNSEIAQWNGVPFVASASEPVDSPLSFWQRAHNRLAAAGITSMVGALSDSWTADTFTNAGQTLQGLSPQSKIFATVGVGLIVAGVVWRFARARQ